MSETANSPETEDRLQPNFGRIRLALRFEVCRWRSLATFSSILTALARAICAGLHYSNRTFIYGES